MKKRTKAFSWLASVELFNECTRAELATIAPLVTPVRIPKGRVLMSEGKVGKEFLVIAEGQVAVTRSTADGLEQIAELNEGDFVGEMALLSGAPRSATVTAATDLTVYACNPGEFRGMLRASPAVAERIAGTSTRRTVDIGGAAPRDRVFTPAA